MSEEALSFGLKTKLVFDEGGTDPRLWDVRRVSLSEPE